MVTILPYKGMNPRIHDSAFLAHGAVVIGDVEIGEHSGIWFNTVVRGDVHYIRIGDRTNVQDNSTLHVTNDTYPLVIGNDITIGHGVVLHGCTIGDRCLIGMGAVILDDAEVGADCIIGAGALVKEGMKVPPGSLVVGLPARVVRQVTPEEKARILRSANNYIEYAGNYRVAEIGK